MTTGIVTPNHEATIRLHILDGGGQSQSIEATIDTGFAGFMNLPISSVAALGLPWVIRDQVRLIDGRIVPVDLFSATVIWNGKARTIHVQALGDCTLIGMAMLAGHDLAIWVTDGGAVSVDAIP